MENRICFRDFEERDIDFIYMCKNNEKLWKYTVGDFHKFSYEEAVEWVYGCMRNDPTYKFWAICKNDETRDIVGWCSIAKIDYETKTVEAHGIVIADRDFNDGYSWVESILFVTKYVFETLKFNKIITCWLSDHPVSRLLAYYSTPEPTERNSVVKNNIVYDLDTVSFTKDAYFSNKIAGNLEILKIMHTLTEYREQGNKLKVKNNTF